VKVICFEEIVEMGNVCLNCLNMFLYDYTQMNLCVDFVFEFVLNLLLSDVLVNLNFSCSLSDDWGNGCGFSAKFGL
jgi:hypothetical protein